MILNQDKSKYIEVRGLGSNARRWKNGYELYMYVVEDNLVYSETLGYYKSLERIEEIVNEIDNYEFFVYEMPEE